MITIIQSEVTVLISFNLHSGPCLQRLHHHHSSWAHVWRLHPLDEQPGGSQGNPQHSQVRSRYCCSQHYCQVGTQPLSRHLGAATHRSAAARAVHCGARSLVGGLGGGSSLGTKLHFPEGHATPSASPCSNLEAETSSAVRVRLQSGAGNCGVAELSPAPRGGNGAQARAVGLARWTLAGG